MLKFAASRNAKKAGIFSLLLQYMFCYFFQLFFSILISKRLDDISTVVLNIVSAYRFVCRRVFLGTRYYVVSCIFWSFCDIIAFYCQVEGNILSIGLQIIISLPAPSSQSFTYPLIFVMFPEFSKYSLSPSSVVFIPQSLHKSRHTC